MKGFRIGFTETGGFAQTVKLYESIPQALNFLPQADGKAQCFVVVEKEDRNVPGIHYVHGANVASRIPAFSRLIALKAIESTELREYPDIDGLRQIADEYAQACAGMIPRHSYDGRRDSAIKKLGTWINPNGFPPRDTDRLAYSLASAFANCLDDRFSCMHRGICGYLDILGRSNAEAMAEVSELFVSVVKDLFPDHTPWFEGT